MGVGEEFAFFEISSRWPQLTSLVAFVAGKLTLKDMFTWRQLPKHFLLERLGLLITLQRRDAWAESWQLEFDCR